jgi:hypothetical protein
MADEGGAVDKVSGGGKGRLQHAIDREGTSLKSGSLERGEISLEIGAIPGTTANFFPSDPYGSCIYDDQ